MQKERIEPPFGLMHETIELQFQTRTNPVTIKLKGLTVNQCWQGKRFKTPEYKAYEKHMLLLLPKIEVPIGKLKVIYEFGVSNMQSDYDNLIKPFQDILQKKYWFNDFNIWEAEIKKVKVNIGEEYCKFEFISIETSNKQFKK